MGRGKVKAESKQNKTEHAARPNNPIRGYLLSITAKNTHLSEFVHQLRQPPKRLVLEAGRPQVLEIGE
jgi:hypothetical protein